MSTLGRTLLLSFFPLFLLAAQLKVYLKENPIHRGEAAQLVIEASGNDIELPKIERIGGYPVAGRARKESVVEVDGELVVQKGEILSFYPDRNMTIGPITVRIDGKEYRSQPIKVVVLKENPKESGVHFKLAVNKREAYVGEPIILEMELKIRKGIDIVNYDFLPPKFNGFWVKELESGGSKYLEDRGRYLVKRLKFLLLPQKAGVLTISPALFKYATPERTTDLFGFSVTAPKWHSVLSNSLQIVAKPLPKDLDLVGDFTLQVDLDKREVRVNEPVNLTVTISGEGNLENFSGIELNISDATIYGDKPRSRIKVEGDRVLSTFQHHFSIIADRDFTIPAIDIEYFSLKERKIKRLHSDPIPIRVIGGHPVEKAPLSSLPSEEGGGGKGEETPSPPNQFPWRSKLTWFLLGFGTALLATALLWLLFRRREGGIFTLKREPSRRKLLKRILPYISESREAAQMAQALYEEIYEGKGRRVRKREVEELLKDLVEGRRSLHP
ncbi:MAG: hypothetical protein C6I05_00635 [Epsilonproteobacteria bacterium]|nr:hypothetical protein [Campylobacterota bacterium]